MVSPVQERLMLCKCEFAQSNNNFNGCCDEAVRRYFICCYPLEAKANVKSFVSVEEGRGLRFYF